MSSARFVPSTLFFCGLLRTILFIVKSEVHGHSEGASIVYMPAQIEVVGVLAFAGIANERALVAMDLPNIRFDAVQLAVGFVAVVAHESLVNPRSCLIIDFNLPEVGFLPAQERDNIFLIVERERLKLRIGFLFRSVQDWNSFFTAFNPVRFGLGERGCRRLVLLDSS